MFKGHRVVAGAMVLFGVLTLGGSRAKAQGPTIDTPDLTSPGGGSSSLGQAPGSGGAGPASNANDSLLGGRPGPPPPPSRWGGGGRAPRRPRGFPPRSRRPASSRG